MFFSRIYVPQTNRCKAFWYMKSVLMKDSGYLIVYVKRQQSNSLMRCDENMYSKIRT
jgi:hypothetical protein